MENYGRCKNCEYGEPSVAAGNGAVHGITHWKTRINSEIVIAIKNAIKAIAYKRLPPGSLFFCKQVS